MVDGSLLSTMNGFYTFVLLHFLQQVTDSLPHLCYSLFREFDQLSNFS